MGSAPEIDCLLWGERTYPAVSLTSYAEKKVAGRHVVDRATETGVLEEHTYVQTRI